MKTPKSALLLFWIYRLPIYLLVFSKTALNSHGQTREDSVQLLQEVTVEAYAAERQPNEIAASIGLVKQADLLRVGNTSFVPVFNVLSGVRMEERSPGSYRFSIRGSLLRSPFGVRNVKFYWKGLPLTDGGGNTYLNLIDFSALGKAEVIKGPGGSLYGAGTGGVVLLNPPNIRENQLQFSYLLGSYGTQRIGVRAQTSTGKVHNSIQFFHQQADGYRSQSAMRRSSLNADIAFLIDPRNTLTTTIFYTDLFYQTPGGLTQAQYDADLRQARPPSGPLQGAKQQQAAVYNKTLYGGLGYERAWSDNWTSTLGLLGSTTEFNNPSIRNYESRNERNLGARLVTQHNFERHRLKGKVNFGGEFQYFYSPIRVTNNVNGNPGAQIFSNDEVTSAAAMGFAQLELEWSEQWLATLGGSLNYLQYEDKRLASVPAEIFTRKFDPVLSPRLAVLRKISPAWSVFASVSHGFSPPTVAEVVPSTGVYNPGLNPETGWSYEGGMSGMLRKSIRFHIAYYIFQLNNTIVIQRDSTGADYFVNAGNTMQEGVEAELNWTKSFQSSGVSTLRLWASFTYNHYRFGQYVNDGQNFSGNALTGVAPVIAVLGADLTTRFGLYANFTCNFVDRLPLNDANTDYASDYFLVGMRTGYRVSAGKVPIELFAGVDNLLNQKYSLGNDLNAAGRRYYNAAAAVNYYTGVSARLSLEKK